MKILIYCLIVLFGFNAHAVKITVEWDRGLEPPAATNFNLYWNYQGKTHLNKIAMGYPSRFDLGPDHFLRTVQRGAFVYGTAYCFKMTADRVNDQGVTLESTFSNPPLCMTLTSVNSLIKIKAK